MTKPSFDLAESAAFRANLVAPSTKALMSSIVTTRGGQVRVLVEDLLVLEGFNPRTPGEKLTKHIRELADSIKANGFYEHHPISCVGALKGKKPVLYVHDGHCRLAAVKLAISEGAEIADLPIVIKDRSCTEEELLVGMVASNDQGLAFSALELSVVCARLRSFGWDDARIAGRIQKTADYVTKLLILAGAPHGIRVLVESGKVSAAMATNALVRHGDGAMAELQKGIELAAASGRSKLTPRFMPEQIRRKALVKNAPQMANALHRVVQHPSFKDMPADLRELVSGLLKDVPPEEVVRGDAAAERAFGERQMQLDGVAA